LQSCEEQAEAQLQHVVEVEVFEDVVSRELECLPLR
ncbi:unnamed protein product, partial [Amoebophrya sp. A25]